MCMNNGNGGARAAPSLASWVASCVSVCRWPSTLCCRVVGPVRCGAGARCCVLQCCVLRPPVPCGLASRCGGLTASLSRGGALRVSCDSYMWRVVCVSAPRVHGVGVSWLVRCRAAPRPVWLWGGGVCRTAVPCAGAAQCASYVALVHTVLCGDDFDEHVSIFYTTLILILPSSDIQCLRPATRRRARGRRGCPCRRERRAGCRPGRSSPGRHAPTPAQVSSTIRFRTF
jgi:hypothetical protein